jgi:hypothetical protein
MRAAGELFPLGGQSASMKCPLSSKQVASLLDDACVRQGYCLPPAKRQDIQFSPPSDIDSFTDAVMIAEGLNPERETKLRRSLRSLVADHFNRSINSHNA